MERIVMREFMVCIVLAFSVLMSAHRAMAAYGSKSPIYGGVGQKDIHIVGQDGKCLDIDEFVIKSNYYRPAILSPCRADKQTQLWNILHDGTIRYTHEYCLVPYNYAYEFKAVVRKCSEIMQITDTKWNDKKDGTLVHAKSGLVLTAKRDNFVNLATNEGTPSQCWQTTENTSPFGGNIKSFQGKCLEYMYFGILPRVYLNDCSKENKNQHWAMYGDGTIRPDNDKWNYCLTSDGSPSSPIHLFNCEDKATQRWDFNEDNLIYQPNTQLVMDVEGSLNLVINHRDGSRSQLWTIY